MADDFGYESRRNNALIVQNEGSRHIELETLARSCELDVLAVVRPEALYLQSDSSARRPANYLLADLRSDPDQYGAALDAITQYLNEYGTELVVWVSAEQVDTVYAALYGSNFHILCDAQDFEAVPILTGALKQMKMQGLRQDDVQTDYRALHRISDELADFARTLARIAEQDDPPPTMVSDRPVSFRPAPPAIFEASVPGFGPPLAQDSPSSALIRNILKLRRKRADHFNSGLFADPAWDILLDLYAADLEGRKVSVSSLCIAASVPPTTALRWISTMTEDGLLQRQHDPTDARRVFIQLSDKARESLRGYFADTGIMTATAI